MSDKSWRDTVKQGVTLSKPVYAAQMAVYQAYMEASVPGISSNPALFTAINKDSEEIWFELVPFDGGLAQRMVEQFMEMVRIDSESGNEARFLDWLATTEHRHYGITEFHPLRGMSAGELRAVLDAHRQRGARFVSFFLDARPASMRTESQLNVFGIQPGNRQFGSERIYEAFRTLVNE